MLSFNDFPFTEKEKASLQLITSDYFYKNKTM